MDAPPQDTWLVTGGQLKDNNFFLPGMDISESCLVAWVPKSHYFYAQKVIDTSFFSNFEWAVNEGISQQFEILKPVFQQPEISDDPNIKIDNYKRHAMLNKIMAVPDKNIPKWDPPKQNPTSKTFWQRLFGRT